MNPVNCRLLNFFKPACRVLFFIISAVIGVWCVGVACWMWHFPVWAWTAFAFALTGLLVSSPWIPEAKWMLLIVEISVMASFFLTTPERAFANTKWNDECEKIAQIELFPSGKIGIFGLRCFEYRTAEDFDKCYSAVVLDPALLDSMDIAFSDWGIIGGAAKHMLLKFNFKDGKELAVSFEPRVKQGMRGGMFLPGIYKQYGQMMLLSVPGDIFDLRSVYRGEKLYCYRTTAQGRVLEEMFRKVIAKALYLEYRPEFYHSVFSNCTTGVLDVLKSDPRLKNPDWRTVFNGYFEEYLFEQGFFDCRRGESFASRKARSRVNGFYYYNNDDTWRKKQ